MSRGAMSHVSHCLPEMFDSKDCAADTYTSASAQAPATVDEGSHGSPFNTADPSEHGTGGVVGRGCEQAPPTADDISDTLRAMGELARALGERDYRNRVDLLKGLRAMAKAGACKEELDAYSNAWTRCQIRALLAVSEYAKYVEEP